MSFKAQKLAGIPEVDFDRDPCIGLIINYKANIQLSYETKKKKLITFHYTGCLIGISYNGLLLYNWVL